MDSSGNTPRRIGLNHVGAEPPAVELDPADRHMLKLVQAWAPYGGPPDDEVFCYFGVTKTQMLRRCTDVVNAQLTRHQHLPPRDQETLDAAHAYLRSIMTDTALSSIHNRGDDTRGTGDPRTRRPQEPLPPKANAIIETQ